MATSGRGLQEELRAAGIRDLRVLEAIARVPRHLFVPADERERAYSDQALPIGHGQTISQPFVVAGMTEALALRGDERVLEIGTGSGYQTAVLALLCAEVVSIEIVPQLHRRAKVLLDALGADNVELHLGDGALGFPARAPYGAILCAAASSAVPDAWVDQLELGGRLVLPVGPDRMSQELVLIVKEATGPRVSAMFPVRFVPLVDEHGNPR